LGTPGVVYIIAF